MRFIDNGDGTITDLTTGLMWQQADDGIKRTWNEAKKYAEALNLAGYSDWRLPTIHELFGLVDMEKFDPAIDPIFQCRPNGYWSGSPYVGPKHAWYVSFYYGSVDADVKGYDYSIRCVRGVRKEEE